MWPPKECRLHRPRNAFSPSGCANLLLQLLLQLLQLLLLLLQLLLLLLQLLLLLLLLLGG